MKIISIISDTIFKVEKVLANIILAIMVLSLFLGVVTRYIFNAPLVWTGEVTLYTLAWVTFIGGSMSIKTNQAVAVTLLTDYLRGMTKKAIVSIGLLICVLFTGLLSYYSIQWISNPTILLQKSDALQLPMIIPYLSVPVGIVFMLIHSINIFVTYLITPVEEGTR
ncbi:TRAP transporter small permease [Niallia sp. Krafla_26]|uniref:TRAP transporter small permease n=1 Tax=Niallia sp. Krafla_26 TaxID=3064703 RepID=UPI003D1636E6